MARGPGFCLASATGHACACVSVYVCMPAHCFCVHFYDRFVFVCLSERVVVFDLVDLEQVCVRVTIEAKFTWCDIKRAA